MPIGKPIRGKKSLFFAYACSALIASLRARGISIAVIALIVPFTFSIRSKQLLSNSTGESLREIIC